MSCRKNTQVTTLTLKTLPAIAGASFRETLLESFEESSAHNILVMTGSLSLFAAVITFSVLYNFAPIALSERSLQLASLRIIGFSRHEISLLLLGEQSLLVLEQGSQWAGCWALD